MAGKTEKEEFAMEESMKGLIFSEPMVKAWMAGRKTVTRRTSGLKEINKDPDRYEFIGMVSGPGTPHAAFRDKKTGDQILVRAPCSPGEVVYIKETWAANPYWSELNSMPKYFYRAGEPVHESDGPWKSGRFMPERASRSHALIVSVRPERIREITEEEAIKEGVDLPISLPFPAYKLGFQLLWESLHPGSWDRNEWVFRYELKKV